MKRTPTKFLPVKTAKCDSCGDSGWKELAGENPLNEVVPCPCDAGVIVAAGFELANEARRRRNIST